VEETVLLTTAQKQDIEVIIEEKEEAKKAVERETPGLAIFTDGSRTHSEVTGYAVLWKNRGKWGGIRTHVGI